MHLLNFRIQMKRRDPRVQTLELKKILKNHLWHKQRNNGVNLNYSHQSMKSLMV